MHGVRGSYFLRQNVFDEHSVRMIQDGRVISGRKDASILVFLKSAPNIHLGLKCSITEKKC